ncbi:hypothetical protein PUR61_08420 [Streptomyces sp. BE20]|uniref:hypothetical protein n=1 Tax=Streptomyces sp. BE20 TaxID=3002525 RepID=UPI002E79D319|nr:hypothetical protein [Streptomyces sp. BE20]MEE1822219.1 hypothetical protein [Streptomyces sp. BE20]
MSRDPYRRLYEDSEIFALHLARRAAGPTLTADTADALHDLAVRHPPLVADDAAIALTGALARLACTALRAASLHHHPLAARLLGDQPTPSAAHLREITGVLDRLDHGLLSTDPTTLGHCFVELVRLALAEQLPGGRSLHESAAEPFSYALAGDQAPGTALAPLVTRAAHITLTCLHHLLGPDSNGGPHGGAALDQILDGFELHKITQQATATGTP